MRNMKPLPPQLLTVNIFSGSSSYKCLSYLLQNVSELRLVQIATTEMSSYLQQLVHIHKKTFSCISSHPPALITVLSSVMFSKPWMCAIIAHLGAENSTVVWFQ